MKFETRIIIYNNNNDNHQNCIKTLNDFLYNVAINQEMRMLYEGKTIECKVVAINDSVYDDAIYRYVEVVLINNK